LRKESTGTGGCAGAASASWTTPADCRAFGDSESVEAEGTVRPQPQRPLEHGFATIRAPLVCALRLQQGPCFPRQQDAPSTEAWAVSAAIDGPAHNTNSQRAATSRYVREQNTPILNRKGAK
jgi:hypothetical protein